MRKISYQSKKIKPGKLNLASNASTEIKAKGIVTITADFEGKTKQVKLNEVLHVPDLRTNLLSVGKISDLGFKIIFEKESAKIIDQRGKDVLYADRVNGLYFVRMSQHECNSSIVAGSEENKSKTNLMEIWHRKMGHLNIRDLIESNGNGTVEGMKFENSNKNFQCEICIQGKMTRATFSKKSDRKSGPLEIIHSDVCGPFRVESHARARYFVTFIDDRSRWCEIRQLKGKHEVLNAFKDFKAFVETQSGNKIKYLQSDNGKEYRNNEFDKFLKDSGIGRRLTVTHTPEQNGVAERKNRTLVEMARCLLIQSGLPPSFWGEAINTANYIRNRHPSNSLDGKTAFEKWTGKIPNVKYFREFGCEVFTLNRDQNKSKLASRSNKGIFLGYSEQSKAYRVCIVEEQRIDITRNMKFIENSKKLNNEIYEDLLMTKSYAPERNEVEIPIAPKLDDIEDQFEDQNEAHDELNENDQNFDSENPEERHDESEEESERSNDEAHDRDVESENPPKRVRGRPRKIYTGLRGRPRKQYQTVNNAEEKTEKEIKENIEEKIEDLNTSECVVCLADIPIREAIKGSESNEWIQAMASELRSIIKNDTWTFVDRPKDRKVIGSRVILRNKYDSNGKLDKRKARIVARGFLQRPGIDFTETFAPVARISWIRTIMALSAEQGMKIKRFDVTTAYLNGELEDEIYMEIPEYT